jgi:hypothetical protein
MMCIKSSWRVFMRIYKDKIRSANTNIWYQ